jgi:hypothetical protein
MLRKIIIPAINALLFATSIMMLLAVSGFLTDTFGLFLLPVFAGNKLLTATAIILLWGLKYGILFFTLTTSWLFFRKRESFPKIFVIWLWIVAACSLIYLILWLNVPILRINIPVFHPSSPALLLYPIAGFILVIFWSLYFKKSQRFKNRFVHKLNKADIVFFVFVSTLIFIFTASCFYRAGVILKNIFLL